MYRKLFCLLTFFILNRLNAQQSFTVTETDPINTNGLEIGYEVKTQEPKTISGQGDFNRYLIKFYITNTNSEPKIIFLNEEAGSKKTSEVLAEFRCLNATGVDYSSKSAILLANPCMVTAIFKERDSVLHKIIRHVKKVQIGYWIKEGETIATNEVLMIPVKEQPKIEVYYNLDSKEKSTTNDLDKSLFNPTEKSATVNLKLPIKLKNIFNNGYINTEIGVPACTKIKHGSLNAQWQLIPVEKTNYYYLKNNGRQNYLDVSNNNPSLSFTNQYASSVWQLEPTHDTNIFKIKNVSTGKYLAMDDVYLILAEHNENMNSSFLIEAP